MRIGALIVGLMMLAFVPAFAADVDGRWTGSMSTPGGELPVTFVFKADGTTLTGHMTGREGRETPIADGRIDGDKVSYSVTIDFGGMPMRMLYKGVVTPDEIKLDVTVFDMSFPLVVKKEN